MTVRDPRHPLYGRTFALAERRVDPKHRKERIFAFFGRGPLVCLPPWALTEPGPDEIRTRLDRVGVEELLATARSIGPLMEEIAPGTEDGG